MTSDLLCRFDLVITLGISSGKFFIFCFHLIFWKVHNTFRPPSLHIVAMMYKLSSSQKYYIKFLNLLWIKSLTHPEQSHSDHRTSTMLLKFTKYSSNPFDKKSIWKSRCEYWGWTKSSEGDKEEMNIQPVVCCVISSLGVTRTVMDSVGLFTLFSGKWRVHRCKIIISTFE